MGFVKWLPNIIMFLSSTDIPHLNNVGKSTEQGGDKGAFAGYL
jgi:hypothetical protein